jgi:hypothetical protein
MRFVLNQKLGLRMREAAYFDVDKDLIWAGRPDRNFFVLQLSSSLF